MDIQPPPRVRVTPPPVIEVAPRARTRKAKPPATPYGYEVIGGPRRPKGMPNDCVWPQGYFVTLEGKSINGYPYRTGADIIGNVWHEFKTGKKDERIKVATHIWRLSGKSWKYMGKARDRDDAKLKLTQAYNQAADVQLVAPPLRQRHGTKAT